MDDPTPQPPISAPAGWVMVGDAFRKEFVFEDFAQAWAFMNRVAVEAERLNHHPDWSNSWNRVVIDLTSHDAGGLTERDLRLALAIDACV